MFFFQMSWFFGRVYISSLFLAAYSILNTTKKSQKGDPIETPEGEPEYCGGFTTGTFQRNDLPFFSASIYEKVGFFMEKFHVLFVWQLFKRVVKLRSA